jgi:hypothetical protein
MSAMISFQEKILDSYFKITNKKRVVESVRNVSTTTMRQIFVLDICDLNIEKT